MGLATLAGTGILCYPPNHNFGFTIDDIYSYSEPSFISNQTENFYKKYDSFSIYSWEEAEGFTWYHVAPGEWIPSLKSRMVRVDTHRPDGVDRDRWIAIDLEQQTLAVYEDGELRFATVIASGAGQAYSDPGVYEVYHKVELHTMQGSYAMDKSDFFYYENVPWALYYNHAQAIHAVYWPAVLGIPPSRMAVSICSQAMPTGYSTGQSWVSMCMSLTQAERHPCQPPQRRWARHLSRFTRQRPVLAAKDLGYCHKNKTDRSMIERSVLIYFNALASKLNFTS